MTPWEKLTGGQCNNSLPLETKKERRRKTLTARQIKDAAMRTQHEVKSKALFDKIDALSLMTTADDKVGARAEHKAMRQTWVKRTMNPGDIYKSKNAKRMPCTISKG